MSVDLSPKTINELFNKQIRDLTTKTVGSFDYQFSDRWLKVRL